MVKFCLWEVKGKYTPFGEAFGEKIPKEWLCQIQRKDWIEEMCARADEGECRS
jgi:hypothetical protein